MMNKIRIEPDSKVKLLQAASVVLPRGLKKGFTVLELMVVITIAGIMATIAVPAFQDWMTHSAVNNAAATILSKLKQGRNMAMAENRNITIKFTTGLDDKQRSVEVMKYDISPVPPKITETIKFKYLLKLRMNNIAKALTFKSLGTTSNPKIEITQNNYYQCITMNNIGRAYMTSSTAKCF